MKKIAVIQDLSGLGKCSLTAAIPVISVMGVQACPLPTAILSNQTGYGSYFWDDYTDHMEDIMSEWKKREFHPDGLYTGFLANENQVDLILRFTELFCTKETLILVDPVMGDQGNAYKTYSDVLCEKMKLLVKRSSVITPNLTEALILLYGQEKMKDKWKEITGLKEKERLAAIESIGRELLERFELGNLVITGIDVSENGEDFIGNLVMERGKTDWCFSLKEGGSYSGTGDIFASVLCAGMVKGMPVKECVNRAVSLLTDAIHDAVEEKTDRNDGVCFEKYLGRLI